MIISELIKQLEKLPQDAEAFVSIWGGDGGKYYWFNGPQNICKPYEGTRNQFVEVAHINNCTAKQE